MPIKQLKIWMVLGSRTKVVISTSPESRTCRATPTSRGESGLVGLIFWLGYHVSSGTLAVALTLTRSAIASWGPTFQKIGAHLHRSWLSGSFSRLVELGVGRRFARMACGDVQMYNVVFVLGGPGAGKGTQCHKIEEVIIYWFTSFFFRDRITLYN